MLLGAWFCLETFHFLEIVQVFSNPTPIYSFFQKKCKYDLVKPNSFCEIKKEQ